MERMGADTVIYGHSRGYRLLAMLSFIALFVSLSILLNKPGFNAIAWAGTVGFAVLTWYAFLRSQRRIAILYIRDDGFLLIDPAQALGIIQYDEIEELRIYALHARPQIGFRLLDPDCVRRRGPAMMRLFIKPIWKYRQYHIIVELDQLNDQVAAIKSVAVRMGIPVRSELL